MRTFDSLDAITKHKVLHRLIENERRMKLDWEMDRPRFFRDLGVKRQLMDYIAGTTSAIQRRANMEVVHSLMRQAKQRKEHNHA